MDSKSRIIKIDELLDQEGPIWEEIESEEGIEVKFNITNLMLFLQIYHITGGFQHDKPEEIEPCPVCNSTNIEFYANIMNVPNFFTLSDMKQVKEKVMCIDYAICECGEYLITDIKIAADDIN